MKVYGKWPILWVHVLAPLVAAQTILLYELGKTAHRYFRGVYLLTPPKTMCLVGFLSSLLLGVVAEIITVAQELSDAHLQEGRGTLAALLASVHAPQVLILISVSILVSCGCLVMRLDCYNMTNKKCFSSPLSLVRTEEGWEVRSQKTWLFLVGIVEVKLANADIVPD